MRPISNFYHVHTGKLVPKLTVANDSLHTVSTKVCGLET